MKHTNNVLIFSTETPSQGAFQREQGISEAQLVFPSAVIGVGCYNGDKETCFIVPYSEDNERKVQALCEAYEQQCYLQTAHGGYSSLHKSNGDWLEQVGRLQEITEEEARGTENYTEVNGVYYTTKGNKMKNELNITKNNEGILLINALAYLLIFSIFMAVAVPKLFNVVDSAKVIATKAEMNNIKVAAMMKGPINNLNQLSSYFDGNGFKKDEYGVNYVFSSVTGELCSTSITYCITIQ